MANTYRRAAVYCWPRCIEQDGNNRVCTHEDIKTGRCMLLTDTDFNGRHCPFQTMAKCEPDPLYMGGRLKI